MTDVHEGGCLCGAVRYRDEHRSDESGRLLRLELGPNCGATVTMTVELLPRFERRGRQRRSRSPSRLRRSAPAQPAE